MLFCRLGMLSGWRAMIKTPANPSIFSIAFFRSLLSRHRNTKGVLRVDQMIRALGGVGNRDLDALGLAVERLARGARAMISNSHLWRLVRWCEQGFIFSDLRSDQIIQFLIHGR